MNCRNCGAAMELMGARRYYFCRHCGSFHFPEPLDEGVRLVDRPAGAAGCAVCRKPLARVLLDDQHLAEYCENCRGVLVQRRHFAEVVERRRAWATTPPAPPQPLDRRALDRIVHCPACARRMTTHPYYGPGNVVIESCEPCELVWLDYGELQQIVDAPGRDRGTRQQPSTPRDIRFEPDDGYSGHPSGSTDLLRTLLDLLS